MDDLPVSTKRKDSRPCIYCVGYCLSAIVLFLPLNFSQTQRRKDSTPWYLLVLCRILFVSHFTSLTSKLFPDPEKKGFNALYLSCRILYEIPCLAFLWMFVRHCTSLTSKLFTDPEKKWFHALSLLCRILFVSLCTSLTSKLFQDPEKKGFHALYLLWRILFVSHCAYLTSKLFPDPEKKGFHALYS